MASLLGEENIPTSRFIEAMYGVEVPGEIENCKVGRSRPSFGPAKSVSFIGKLMAVLKVGNGQPIESSIQGMNVVLAPRLLAEMDAALEAAGLHNSNPLEFMQNYFSDSDSDDDATLRAQLALVLFRAFLAAGLKHNHLVWWVK